MKDISAHKNMHFVNYLKDAQLVANFQRFFGIQYLPIEASNGRIHESFSSKSPRQPQENHLQTDLIKRSTNGLTKRTFDTESKIESDNNVLSSESNCSETKENKRNYVINNLFFYYIFCFGASLGYEIFYAIFFPFFLHNIDSYVGRRLIVIWSIVMYIGQALKDIIRWNRPKSPPVVVLEPEYSMEYGMPSTHAMVGFALPFSIFIFTQTRYVYPFWLGFTFASVWCLLVCGSRLYLGMHTVLDILAGLILSAIILFICVPLIDLIDELHYKSPIAPFITLIIVSLMSIYYPKSDRWSPARGDTCVMVGFGYGTLVGTWFNYQLGTMNDPTDPLPYRIEWPETVIIYSILAKTLICTISIELTRLLGKKVIYPLLCRLQNLNFKNAESIKVPSIEVPLKLMVYSFIGINVSCSLPILFKRLNLDL